MDLTNILREASLDIPRESSLIDHSWYGNGLMKPGEPTFDPVDEGIKKRNNVKPELEVEWGMAGPQIDLDEPAGVVERNLPPEAMQNSIHDVIMFARDQQNRGRQGNELVRALKAKFDQPTLRMAKDGLRKQFALDGVVGCIAVDGRGYKSCQEALKVAAHSPYKHYIKHVIGCQCGDPHMIPSVATATLGKLAGMTKKEEDEVCNATDAFFADEQHTTSMTAHCRSTMLPILSWRGDLDPSEMDSTMIDIQNTSGLPEGAIDHLWEDRKNGKYSSNIEMLKAAFRQIASRKQKASAGDYSGKTAAGEFMLQQADNEISFAAPAQADLDMIPEQAPIDIAEQDAFAPQDVEMGQFMEPEFEGTDEVSIDDVVARPGSLELEMMSNPEDEDLGLFAGDDLKAGVKK